MEDVETDDDTSDINGFYRDRNDEYQECDMENDGLFQSDSDKKKSNFGSIGSILFFDS